MSTYKILIVEDELLIANTIKRYLQRHHYQVVGMAISYEEAIQLYKATQPDLALLDIRLNSRKTGIDVGRFMQTYNPKSKHIYLTSQSDTKHIKAATATYPSGYLTKPIRSPDLTACISLALFNHSTTTAVRKLSLGEGSSSLSVVIDDILYLEADHVYVKIHLYNGRTVVHRSSITELLTQLPNHRFVQTHRSFAVNLSHVEKYDSSYLYVHERAIPLGRSRRKQIVQLLKHQ
jgi:DNA-binding LytR/AlgR family response regulator